MEPSKNKEKRLPQARQTFTKPLRNVRLGSLQATRPNSRKRCLGRACEKAEPQQVLCRSHCETAARKMPTRRFWNPLKRKKYSAQTMRSRSQKTAETLLLEPTKNKEKMLRKVASSKAQRNVRLGSLQAPGPNARKRCLGRACEKAEPQQVLCPSHCETAAGKMPKRRCWNPLKRKINICPNHAKPQPENCRNVAFGTYEKCRKEKNAETLLLEPTKNKEKRLPQARQTFAQRKTWKPASHQTKLKKKVFGTACEKAEPQQVLCPSHCETAAGKMPKRRFWNPLKRKKYSAQTMRNRSQKTAETLLLEPTNIKISIKTKKKPASHQAKLKKKVFGTRMRKSRTPAGFVPKPLRNRSQKNAETSLLEPTKKPLKRKK